VKIKFLSLNLKIKYTTFLIHLYKINVENFLYYRFTNAQFALTLRYNWTTTTSWDV